MLNTALEDRRTDILKNDAVSLAFREDFQCSSADFCTSPFLLVYRYLYVPIATRPDEHKHRRDLPLPPVPSQICGENHRERHYPNGNGMGL